MRARTGKGRGEGRGVRRLRGSCKEQAKKKTAGRSAGRTRAGSTLGSGKGVWKGTGEERGERRRTEEGGGALSASRQAAKYVVSTHAHGQQARRTDAWRFRMRCRGGTRYSTKETKVTQHRECAPEMPTHRRERACSSLCGGCRCCHLRVCARTHVQAAAAHAPRALRCAHPTEGSGGDSSPALRGEEQQLRYRWRGHRCTESKGGEGGRDACTAQRGGWKVGEEGWGGPCCGSCADRKKRTQTNVSLIGPPTDSNKENE